MITNPVHDEIPKLPKCGQVLDVGCLHFLIAKMCTDLGRPDLQQFGTDYMDLAADTPAGVTFRKADLSRERIPYADDSFDLVVASHIIEHLPNAIEFAAELVRVAKPGALIYVEAPSERSLWLPSMPFQQEKFLSLNFYDDPTHQLRPWPPQALHRLFRYLSCEIVFADYYYSKKIRILFPFYLLEVWWKRSGRLLEKYVWLAFGWCAFALVRKPQNLRGAVAFNYYIPKDR
jgi:SAM-dependent methyltransferase